MDWHSSWKTTVKLTVAITLAISLLLPVSDSVSAAYGVQEQINKRTKQDLITKWQAYAPQSFTLDQLFENQPHYNAPHQFGKVNDKVLQDALNATNFARYLAGLPDDVTLDYTLADQQQAGAVIMAELGTITHYPSQPTGMADHFYQLGYEAASSSNLSAGRKSLYDTVFFGYMADNSPSNLETVGHRRWILNPQMKKTMFGLAYNPSSNYTYYSSMYSFNRERNIDDVSYQYIAWPSAGIFPTEVLTANDPWSITLNPDVYDLKKYNEIYVTIHRESDNKQWKLDETKKNTAGDFFKIERSGYGVSNAIIFRPSEIGAYIADDVYHITIHNVYTKDGEKTSISYSTQMIDLQATYKISSERHSRFALVGQKLKFPINGQATRYVSSDPSVATVDNNGVVTALKGGYTYISVDNYLNKSNSSIYLSIREQKYPISEWAKDSILKANEIGMLDTNPYYYDLSKAVTRQQFVNYVVAMLETLNVQIDDSIHDGRKSPFSDVSSDDNDILWAYENGIINGTGNGKFSPNDTITREQAATLLLNVYQFLKGNEKPATLPPFSDQDMIANWAQNSVKRAAELSIMGGVGGNRFDPKGKYSHEQTIATLLRLSQKFDN